jgi:glycosyltransferase involved in cell wall biosynthesis
MQQYPLISVIMPTYNCAKYIAESVISVTNQNYPNIELLVINDGSSDNTDEVLQSFMSNIRYFKTKNKGVSAARNLGITMARGNWIAFCDADDIWFPEKLKTQFNNLDGNLWSYTNSFYMGSAYKLGAKRSDMSELVKGDIFKSLALENVITTSSVLISKAVLDKLGGFDETLPALEDWQLWLLVAKNHSISLINEPMLNYRVHAESTSRKARSVLPLHIKVINSAFASDYSKKTRKVAMLKAYSICSYIAEQGDDYTFALYCAYKSFMTKPTSVDATKRLLVCLIKLLLKPIRSASLKD